MAASVAAPIQYEFAYPPRSHSRDCRRSLHVMLQYGASVTDIQYKV
jgi:hypothetical protein